MTRKTMSHLRDFLSVYRNAWLTDPRLPAAERPPKPTYEYAALPGSPLHQSRPAGGPLALPERIAYTATLQARAVRPKSSCGGAVPAQGGSPARARPRAHRPHRLGGSRAEPPRSEQPPR